MNECLQSIHRRKIKTFLHLDFFKTFLFVFLKEFLSMTWKISESDSFLLCIQVLDLAPDDRE